jgi:hypothetical protein
MAKGGLSNQLLGKMIVPKPEYGSTTAKDEVNGRVWAGLKPTLSGQMVATIDAAWTEERTTRIAVHDPWGNIVEMSLTLVNLKGEN